MKSKASDHKKEEEKKESVMKRKVISSFKDEAKFKANVQANVLLFIENLKRNVKEKRAAATIKNAFAQLNERKKQRYESML